MPQEDYTCQYCGTKKPDPRTRNTHELYCAENPNPLLITSSLIRKKVEKSEAEFNINDLKFFRY